MKSETTKSFITGGGEMGELIRRKDWSKTAIGDPENWPQSLKITINILLNSKFPMFLWWGPDLLCFYNDAYRPSLGKEGKHPFILGMEAHKAWPEIWHIIKPLIDHVLTTGEATWSENQLVPIYRNNRIEDVYWTFSYSSVNDELSNSVGVFVTCYETTQQVQNLKAFKEREDQLSFIIDAAELGTWDLNPVTNRFTGNARLKSWFGLAQDAEIELPLALNNIIESDRQRVIDAIQHTLQFSSGGNYDIEYTIRNPATQQERIVLAKGKALFDQNHKAYRFSGTLQDITQQVKAIKNLKESEQKFRFLADSLPQFVWTSTPQGSLNYYNQSVVKYSGLKPEEFKEDKWFEMVHSNDREENIRKWREAISTGQDFLFEHRFRRYDGTYRWHLSRATPQRDTHGNIQMWVGTSTDIEDQKSFSTQLEKEVESQIKEQKRLNAILKKSEERYHLMVEEVQDYAIFSLSRNGIVENWNKGAEKIKGYTAPEIIGKSFSAFYPPQDKASGLPEKLLQEAISTGRVAHEGWRIRKDGSPFWANVVITAIHNESGEVIGFSKVTHDLTEKKQAEDRRKADALVLKQKNKELERINTELQSFAYVASHDLQEPLRKIQTFSGRLLEKETENLSAAGIDYLGRMRNAVRRMQTLIEDLLAYSRTNSVEKVFEKISINEVVNEIKEDFKEIISETKAVIEVEVLCEVKAIPFQFKQLLTNLIGNSLKFLNPEIPPKIQIQSRIITATGKENVALLANQKYCHISITDNGIGFENEYSERIFEMFQRLHGKSEYKGTGIGLAIVKKIVDNHHGFITANGIPNQGATFDIYIPAEQL
ncbi:PAS domain-containing sensor histidine kinase [Emticicia agri]|uniref:histidine kinase n=1 Tax=Emticicia agri TaxID=2492393 RepID=A0A4Q5M2K7_9BACT|nr:PAS domain-containing sensor histidine kinase [Emticicia agri]RYU96345.1 PAS domain-containing sensor histidine kinase [Emticicia agri]